MVVMGVPSGHQRGKRPFGNELADSQCARISKLRIRAAKPGSLCGWCSLCFRLASRTKHDPMGVRYGAAHIIAFVCIACRKGWVGDDADISGLDSPPTLSLSLSLLQQLELRTDSCRSATAGIQIDGSSPSRSVAKSVLTGAFRE